MRGEQGCEAPFRETPTIPELVVVSGKGGTGKTGIAASLLALFGHMNNAAAADCDVDAADLHLILSPENRHQGYFSGGKKALIDQSRCVGCGTCRSVCRFDAVRDEAPNGRARYSVDAASCEGCGVCVDSCETHAIDLAPAVSGEWFVSDSRFGPFAHARLGIASENSGKLVSLVRTKGREAGGDAQRSLIICDGSPGIGCPVISSLTGAQLVLIVAEPTLSGLHDMKRIAKLCGVLGVKAGICVNKADLNLDVTAQIEVEAELRGILKFGRIRYDESVVAAQLKGLSVVEYNEGPASTDIRTLFEKVKVELSGFVLEA
jgi:MinD superfamily P-loop ATPase